MCGIAGIFAYHVAADPVDRTELRTIREHMLARGPDGAGEWFAPDERIGLAHRRLAILDLSDRGAQPMACADGRYVIVFNGEIYNHPELRQELERDGVVYRSGTDTETLLHLWSRQGSAMVHRLRGMYAFAVWDTVERTLFLARDPYGIKPLWYANDGWTFRFASQAKALLAGGRVSRDPEPAGFVGFQLWGHVPEPFSLHREIRALPAGHTMMVDWLGPKLPQRFHHVAEVLHDATPVDPARREATIREAVADSVRHHLLADVEVGVFLSAGVDSGAILGLVAEIADRPPRAITLAFDEFRGTAEDEAPLAATVAEHYGARHLVRTVGEAEFRADLAQILDAMDTPSIDGVNTWFVAKAAREAGLKVALSGLGGDELLAGYPSFVDVPRWHRRLRPLRWLPGSAAIAARLLPLLAPDLVRRQPKLRHLPRHGQSIEGAWLAKRALYLPEELPSILDPDLLVEGLRRLRPMQRLAATLSPDPGSDNGRITALESCHYMRDQLLRDSDWAGMAHSLEIRTPLVDATLLARVAPCIGSLAPGEGKRALAKAPAKPLPDAIVNRAKTGFGVPTGAWLSAVAAEATQGGAAGASKGAASRAWSAFVADRARDPVGPALE
jgi:asparagine synthase (glutamine-hydrolysing)